VLEDPSRPWNQRLQKLQKLGLVTLGKNENEAILTSEGRAFRRFIQDVHLAL
jgi:hypothetical protein